MRTAEREAAVEMLGQKPASRRVSLSGDKGYDAGDLWSSCGPMNLTPHVAHNDAKRHSAIDERTTRHPGYAVSQRKRKRVEEVFGWMKTAARQRKNALSRTEKNRLDVHFGQQQRTTW